MAIYTKTGDKGTTSLFDGARVKKYELRVEAYGTFDELNANISLCAKYVTSEENKTWLTRIQRSLFYLCAELATEHVDQHANIIRITAEDIHVLESAIDECLKTLPEVHQFILPGKSKAASYLHVSRTLARRAERLLVRLNEQAEIRQELLQYVNRLSDFLYTMAREEDFRYELSKVTEEIVSRYTSEMEPEKQCFTELSLAFCSQLAIAVEEVATKENVPVTMSIVNKHGEHLFHYRMKDALLVSIRLAEKKAYTSIAMKSATHELSELIQPGGPLYQLETLTDGEIVTFGGGIPIYNNAGEIIGGLGISGGSVEQDITIAEQALSRIEMR